MKESNFNKERFREAMGDMTAVELAAKLGCTKSSISMYLSGQREPSKMAIQLISLILGVNPAWLCGLDVPKYSNAKIISKEPLGSAETEPRGEKETLLLELLHRLTEDQKDSLLHLLEGVVAQSK
ncbi:MAG: helix-turn-helix transcriptional regulator [Oscillospiraceae bacterium]|nr:helix-turn-helix transcriptional regulator [Oscillospiraceae bacterium]